MQALQHPVQRAQPLGTKQKHGNRLMGEVPYRKRLG
jgi:hypothetical protein